VTRRIALVTAREALALDPDMPPLIAAVAAAGFTLATPCWDDPEVDWSCFDAALLRSTWDYVPRAIEFRAFVERAARRTRLYNPPAQIAWSLDKHCGRSGQVHLRTCQPTLSPAHVRT